MPLMLHHCVRLFQDGVGNVANSVEIRNVTQGIHGLVETMRLGNNRCKRFDICHDLGMPPENGPKCCR